mmetsp:Transcript_6052/g.14995  ORF Transcript_6052/g.14995 Transcript_6052/m.14995 type:complete len:502 (-) Transcript_6052:150-1655(-)
MKSSSKPIVSTDKETSIARIENESHSMKGNDLMTVSMAISKRKADLDPKRDGTGMMELCLPSAFDKNNLNSNKAASVEDSFNVELSADVKRGKRNHLPFASSETTSSAVEKSSNGTMNKYRSGEEEKSLPVSHRSRLQQLQNHGIMPNVLSFLDETGLFQIENTYTKMIGSISIARQWCYLFVRDQNKTIPAQKKWRPMNEMDTKAIGDNGLPKVGLKNEVDCEEHKDCDDSANGYRSKNESLARHIGRNFAQEALFVCEREKEAEKIYKFDHIPKDESDIPIFTDHRSLTCTEKSILASTLASSRASFQGKMHWCEWYDFRANSVNEKYAFVRLSLRDGSGRFWHGFRRLTTNYNTTFFRLHFDMKELIKDMQWTELEFYLKFNDTTYSSMQNRLKAMEPLMRMTQLTVSLDEKLLVATGGYSPSFGSFAGNGKCYFHPRHYQFPLASSTQNDLEWLPYRVSLDDNLAQNELVIQFECDHANLPFMRAQDIGNPNACAHW